MEELIKENMILKMRCRRLILILNECLSYVDDIDENIKLLNKIEEIKNSLEEDKCKLKRKCGCGKPPHKEDPEIIEYLKSIQK
jgi:hypothetical protein